MTSRRPQDREPVAGWREVRELFGLDRPISAPAAVTGGWMHNLWRVRTSDGVFAVKEMVDSPYPGWIDAMGVAIELEVAAWRSGSVGMAEPLPAQGSAEYLGRPAGATQRIYRCHRWVEGSACLDQTPSIERSHAVGTMLAAIVELDRDAGTTDNGLQWNALDAYEDTVAEAEATGASWARLLSDLRGVVEELGDDLGSLSRRRVPMLVMHRDVDPKNAIARTDGSLALVDWDDGGPARRESELLGAALSFAGGPSASDPALVHAHG